ncbi:MAG: hypothetical protein JWM33_754 [Caulobacteraceae bacterium]|nr:hypothetical protein [Caulobacteraceae bacterium]
MRSQVPALAAIALSLAFAARAGAASAPAQGPDALPGLVVGVVGSGDQLSLQIKADESGRRALRIGDAFQDGWSLSALTPSTATLTKAGESRVVGLNPTGAVATHDVKRPSLVQVAGSELPPEVIEVLALTDEEVIARTPTASQRLAAQYRGLTAEESRRYTLMSLRYGLFAPSLNARMQAQMAAARAAGINAQPAIQSERFMLPAFGQDYADLWYKTNAAFQDEMQAKVDTARAAGAPEMVRFPAGQDDLRTLGVADYNLVYLRIESDANGVVYALSDQRPLRTLDQVFPGSEANVQALTQERLQGLVGPDGAPVDAATQAAILAQNVQDRAAEAARLAAINDPSIQYFGPYGPVARR